MTRTFVIAIVILSMTSLSVGAEKWKPVPPVDWSKIKPAGFSDDELDLPYYLARFHEVANAIVEEGPDRGFIAKRFWRNEKDNKPYNARVMESHLTLAYMYCTKRPWNPYFASADVRDRLEAMLARWCDMQNDDGRFSEYGPKQWNLPATAFATKFMAETLILLKEAGDAARIDDALHKRVIAADRKAIIATLTMKDLYEHGKRYTNQYTNVFAGAGGYLSLFPDDAEIKELIEHRIADVQRDFQSPCGYLYEADGPDFGYTLHTYHSNAEMAFHYLAGTAVGEAFVEMEGPWNEWLGYNLLREPDGSTFAINRGIETRQKHAAIRREDGALAEVVPSARAFATSKEEHAKEVVQMRRQLAESWGKFDHPNDEERNSPYSPYIFLQREAKPFYPTNAQRDDAIKRLPYLAKQSFTHQRVDSRKKAVFTFIRRPTYYATFSSGDHITDQQRLGLDLIWLPKCGAVLQSQTGTADAAWGTRFDGAEQVCEATEMPATFIFADQVIQPMPGNKDLPIGKVIARYALQKEQGGKTITFDTDAIDVAVDHKGAFVEQIPLLTRADNPVALADGSARLKLPHGQVLITFPPGTQANLTPSDQKLFNDKIVTVLTLPASDTLTYHLLFTINPD